MDEYRDILGQRHRIYLGDCRGVVDIHVDILRQSQGIYHHRSVVHRHVLRQRQRICHGRGVVDEHRDIFGERHRIYLGNRSGIMDIHIDILRQRHGIYHYRRIVHRHVLRQRHGIYHHRRVVHRNVFCQRHGIGHHRRVVHRHVLRQRHGVGHRHRIHLRHHRGVVHIHVDHRSVMHGHPLGHHSHQRAVAVDYQLARIVGGAVVPSGESVASLGENAHGGRIAGDIGPRADGGAMTGGDIKRIVHHHLVEHHIVDGGGRHVADAVVVTPEKHQTVPTCLGDLHLCLAGRPCRG